MPTESQQITYSPDSSAIPEKIARVPPQSPKLPTLVRTTALMSPDTHASQITAESGKLGQSEYALQSALSAQRQMTEQVAALEQVRNTRSPSDTAQQHFKKAGDAYQRILRSAASRYDASRSNIQGRLAQIEGQISQALGLHDTKDATEIRQALRTMSKEDRSAAVLTAIKQKDGAVLGAVFSGREITTGIPDTQRDSFRRRAEQAHAPELLQLRVGLEKANQLVSDAFDNLVEMESQVVGAPEVKSEFERQIEASDKAWFEFDAAMQ